MKKIIIIMISLFLSQTLFMMNCERKHGVYEANRDDDPSGTYFYAAYDRDGIKVVEGTMILWVEDAAVTGTKDFEAISSEAYEAGVGEIVGEVLNGRMRIILNPQEMAQIILDGTYEDGSYPGDRLLDMGAPPMVAKIGEFEAIKCK